MKLRRALRTTLRALLAHRVRSLLAATSVAVGVAAVVLTRAIGDGAEAELRRELESMGTNLLVVRPVEVARRVARKETRGLVTTLELEDHAAIARLPRVQAAVPGASASLRVKAGAGAMVATVQGTTPAFQDVRRFSVRAGRFLDDDDVRDATRVAVIGARVAELLFAGDDPLGRTLRVRGVPFEVVGVLAAKGVLADGSDEDALVVVPLRTAQRRIFNISWLDAVFVSVREAAPLAAAERDLRALLRDRHGADDFAVQDKTRFLAAQQETVRWLTVLTTGLAALALLVGGTGILALMLLGVRERTAEIGLRVALGARPGDILAQWLTEAALLATGGWALGLALGAAGAAVVALATEWRVQPSASTALGTWIVSVGAGLVFGSVPARKASLVPPIQALASR